MLVKFEVSCARVKGLSFHPKRSWILASLHSGSIHLWDYQLNYCIEKFEGHDGPVRGISFHHEQSLFVSGGDDYRVKVWNYQLRRCLFTLLGHVDYVRSTSFHRKHPWILSCSDDQTVRIWNWQSRNLLAVLTGHSHYVMSAEFHPTSDLIVSSSLDQTIRVWDITGVVRRHASMTPPKQSTSSSKSKLNVELFGENDYTVRFVLEGHEKGVNYATFHPTLPLILSGADDRTLKLWRMGDDKAWEIDTIRGHYNNISAVLFHPRQPVVVSVSEDKSLRVWDMTKRTCLQSHRRPNDRFWMVGVHPTQNIFCAGHDSGFSVFKLERERPIYALHDRVLFYMREKYVRRMDFGTGIDASIMRVKGEGKPNYSMLSYNPVENSFLLSSYDNSYELYLPPDREDYTIPPDSPRDYKKSSGRSACWVGRNRFAVLYSENQILIKTNKNDNSKKIHVPFNCSNIFTGSGPGMLIIQQRSTGLLDADKGMNPVVLFDIQQKQIVTKLKSTFEIKRVVWSKDKNYVALLGKSSIVLCNKKLEMYCSITGVGKVKSGAWRDSKSEVAAFIYTTSNHIKYALTNGEGGTVRTMDVLIYIIFIQEDMMVCMGRDTTIHYINLDARELLFKTALAIGNYDYVSKMIRNSSLVGQAIISYLHNKGYPEIALHFVQSHDQLTRFNLALECCNVDVALECARALENPSVWNKLADMALLLGNHLTAELCYQRTRNFYRLAFLYLVTGQKEKLNKLNKVSASQGNSLSYQYWLALISGDVEGQVKVLRTSNGPRKLALANEITRRFQLTDTVEDNKATIPSVTVDKIHVEDCGKDRALSPVPLFVQQENWPLLTVSKSIFGTKSSAYSFLETPLILEPSVSGGWDVDIFGSDFNEENEVKEDNLAIVESESGWDDSEAVVLPSPSTSSTNLEDAAKSGFYVPVKGFPVTERWASAYRLAIVHVLAGNFESAARLLQDQIGVVNLAPFRDLFLRLYTKSHVVFTTMPNMPSFRMYPVLPETSTRHSQTVGLPRGCNDVTLKTLVQVHQRECHDLVTKGQFLEAVTAYRKMLLNIPLTLVKTKPEATKGSEMIAVCKEYILGLQMELYRKTLPKEDLQDQRRSLELAAYFTHCSMNPAHLMLALRTAMNLSYRLGYFKNATGFCRRLLELGPSGDLVAQTRKLLKASENQNDSAAEKLEYDEHNPFTVCAKSYKPIYRGKPGVPCSFCGAAYMPEYAGKVCEICTVAEIGRSVVGLRISPVQFR